MTAAPLSNAALAFSSVTRGTASSVCGMPSCDCVNTGSMICVGSPPDCGNGKSALQASVTRMMKEIARIILVFCILPPNGNSVYLCMCLTVYITLQFAIPVNTFADDGEAVFPEFAFGNVYAEALGKFCGGGFACGGQQIFVICHEFIPALLIDGI